MRAIVGGFALLLLGATRSEAITFDQLPTAAREAISREVKRHPILGLTRETRADGSTVYDVQFKTLTEGRVEAEVAPDGGFLGRWGRLDEPAGSGP